MPAWLGHASAGGVVLTYHSIGRRPVDPYGQAVSPATFERQLRILKRATNVVTAATIADCVRRKASSAGLSAVTFDDGYSDVLSEALPVLERLQVPMTLFVTTDPVSQACPFWWDRLTAAVLGSQPPDASRHQAFADVHARLKRLGGSQREDAIASLIAAERWAPTMDLGRPLTAEELRHLAAHPLVDIGAHTVSHPSLASLSEAEQRFELVESQRWLESHLAQRIRLLAYPFGKAGDVSEVSRTAAKGSGYHAAFVTTPGPVTPDVDVMAIPRLTVHEWSDAEFEQRLRRVTSI